MSESPAEERRSTGRLEAFSDGVFAIAITLLVLEIKVPRIADLPEGHSLTTALLHEWPAFLAYFVGFLTILVMWINHHNVYRYVRHTTHVLLILNGILLLWVSLIPFTTALVAEYLERPDEKAAAFVFNGTYLLMALTFNLLWRYISHTPAILSHDANKEAMARITQSFRFGPLFYLVIIPIGLVSSVVSFALVGVLAVFFALPNRAMDAHNA